MEHAAIAAESAGRKGRCSVSADRRACQSLLPLAPAAERRYVSQTNVISGGVEVGRAGWATCRIAFAECLPNPVFSESERRLLSPGQLKRLEEGAKRPLTYDVEIDFHPVFDEPIPARR